MSHKNVGDRIKSEPVGFGLPREGIIKEVSDHYGTPIYKVEWDDKQPDDTWWDLKALNTR